MQSGIIRILIIKIIMIINIIIVVFRAYGFIFINITMTIAILANIRIIAFACERAHQ